MSQPIPDSERVLRHIPGGDDWQVPPDGRPSSVNFRLRPGESGLSVSRQSVTTSDQLMARLGDPNSGSKIVVTTVAEIRALGFDVVDDPIQADPGHALIVPKGADLTKKVTQRALGKIFRYVDTSDNPPTN